jgi:hypothetical protein
MAYGRRGVYLHAPYSTLKKYLGKSRKPRTDRKGPITTQVPKVIQSEFFRQCDLVLLISIYSIFLFPSIHATADYIFFLFFPSMTNFSNQVPRKI